MKASVIFGSLICASVMTAVMPAVAADTDAASAKARIGISLPTQNIERFHKEGLFLQQAFEAEGYAVSLFYAGDDDLEIQQRQITRMVDEDCDVIIVGAVDCYQLDEQLQKARAKGIPVIAYGSLLMNTDAVDYLVGFDAWRAGEMQGNYLRTALKLDRASAAEPKNIEVFSGMANDSNSRAMFDGAMSVLEPYIASGSLKVLSGQTDFDSATVGRSDADAICRMDNLIASLGYGPQGIRLDGVLSPTDEASEAIIHSLQKAGYTSSDMPRITGQDCSALGVHNIEGGLQGMSVFQDGRLLANTAVRMTDSILSGGVARITEPGIDNGVKHVPAYECQPEYLAEGKYADVLVRNGYLTRFEIENPF